MANDETKYYFAVIPARAFGDPRLSAADFRVLGIISYADRMGRNGSGCYATQQWMKERTGLAVPTISAAIKKLVSLGYLHKERQENRRRYQYFVIHDTEPPEIVVSDREEAHPNQGRTRDGEASADDEVSWGEASADDEELPSDTSRDDVTKNIPPKGNKSIPPRSASRKKISTRRCAPDGAHSPPFCYLPAQDDSEGKLRGKAAQLKRWAKENPGGIDDAQQVGAKLSDRIEEITDDVEAINHVWRVEDDLEDMGVAA